MDAGQINGTRVVWETGPGPFRASLTFRAGLNYESLPSRGAAEVIAHTVLAAVTPRLPPDLDAGVEIAAEATVFFATGSRDSALAYLSAVSRELRSPRLRQPSGASKGRSWALAPRDLIAARALMPAPPSFEEPLKAIAHRLYGHTGVGRRSGVRPELAALTAVRLAEVARACFHADNAIIALTGPPPTTWDFELPTGDQPAFPSSIPTGLPRRCVLRLPIPAPAIAVDLSHDPSGIALLSVLVERMGAEASRRGIRAPVIDPGVLVARDHLLMTYVLDGGPSAAASAVEALWVGFHSLFDVPPTEEELHEVARAAAARADDPDHLERRLDEAGSAHLSDFGPKAVLQEAAAPPTPASLAAVAQAAAPSLVLMLPLHAAGAPSHGLADHTQWSPPDPQLAMGSHVERRSRWHRGPGLSAVDLSEAGLGLQVVGEPRRSMAWSAIAGVERVEAVRRVHGLDGRCLEIDAERLSRPERLLAALDARTEALAWDAG